MEPQPFIRLLVHCPRTKRGQVMNRTQFVILWHKLPQGNRPSHFDLMIEQMDSLVTWELVDWPTESAVKLRRLPDHRLEYLEYEGPVSANRGTVQRFDRGELDWQGSWSRGQLELRFRGTRVRSAARLERGSVDGLPAGTEPDSSEWWMLEFETEVRQLFGRS